MAGISPTISKVCPVSEEQVEIISNAMNYEPVKKFSMRKRALAFMESPPLQALFVTCLFISLFYPDAWVMANAPGKSDDGKDIVEVIVMAIFIVETTVYSFCQTGYLFGFYFWMDIIGTLSMLLDINWITDTFDQNDGEGSASYLRAVRAAKLGARYGRLMRFFKFLKFLRYLPCFKRQEEIEPTMSSVRKVSTELAQRLIRAVAFLTLVLVIIVPFISVPIYDYSTDSFMNMLQSIASSDGSDTGVDNPTVNFDQTVQNFAKFVDHYNPVFRITVKSPFVHDNTLTTVYLDAAIDRDVRPTNIIVYKRSIPSDGFLEARLSIEEANYWDAFCGVWLMILVVVVLLVYSVFFQTSVDSAVNDPLEKSTRALRNCASTMLKSMKALELDKELESIRHDDDDDKSDLDEELETQMLEKLVEKLARIVQNMFPGTEDLVVDKNVDIATLSWLNQSYASKSTKQNNTDQVELRSVKKLESSIVSTEVLNSWSFDVLLYDHEQLYEIIHLVFDVFDIFGKFNVSTTTFALFTKEISARYIQNRYHNFKHGCDVLHATYNLTFTSNLHSACSTLELFALLTAALAHDVGHPGVNNIYLVKSKHKLAIRHNDKSPLENMHCAVLYEILGKSELNIFSGLSESQWRDTRKIIIACILGTDMLYHMDQVKKVQLFLELNGSQTQPFSAKTVAAVPPILLEYEQRLFMMEIMLHCADISNPYKPFEQCSKWADLVLFEFCAQGDREKKEGLEVSPMMDRDAINLYNMQLGFIEFMVAPLIISVINILPALHEVGDNMLANFNAWGNKRKDEIDASDVADKLVELKKIDDRLANFSNKMSFLNQMKELTAATQGNTISSRQSKF